MARILDLVGIADIAAEHGVARNSAWRWTQRDDFPAPVAIISGRTPVWTRGDVELWAAKHLPLVAGRPRVRP